MLIRAAVSQQDEKVVLTWEAPANGACVDKYDVKVTDLTAQDTRSWIEQDESGQEETDKLRLVIENLKNGREYLFEVMAVSDAPPAPRDRNSRDCSRQRRTVSVSTLMRFFFTGQMSSDNDCDREEPPSQLESKDATARVYSTPRPKRSPPAPTVWPVEEEYAPPGPPSSLIALGHNEKITLRWDPPANDGGCPIEEYSVNVKPVNPTTRSALLPSWDVNSREHEVVIEELDNCEYYQLTVRAQNCDGWGASMDVVGTPIPTREPTVASPLFLGMWCPV
eukprot:jgi/Tetstr1/432240/TSEL_002276.t1